MKFIEIRKTAMAMVFVERIDESLDDESRP
jgi:hypothetical protein